MSMLGSRARPKIRPPRRGLERDADNFEDMWRTLSESLTQIHDRNASALSFEELYRNAYKLVLKKHGEQLYVNVKNLVAEHLRKVANTNVKPLRPGAVVGGEVGFGTAAIERREVGNKFLVVMQKTWEHHQLCMGMITDVLMYMDRVYCTDNKKPFIHVACTALFRESIMRNRDYNIGNDLNKVILDQIQMERDGDTISRSVVRACIYMLEGLYESESENEGEKLYLTVFEPAFIRTSDEFYQKEAQRLLRECDAATYIRKTERRLVEERDRSQNTVSPLSEIKIRDVVEKRLITENIKEVMEMEASGLNFMLENDKYEDLALLYRLMKRVDINTNELKRMLRLRIIDLGKEVNKGLAAPVAPASANNGEGSAAAGKPEEAMSGETAMAIKWVEDVLVLKDKFDHMWELSFEADQGVQQTISKAFAEFINMNKKSSEFISLFVDENIKKGLKGKTEAEVDQVLDKAIVLFRYIQDKDVFERYYKKHLSKRLILGKSISNDVERAMISKFKVEVGYAFTSKMEGMFKDMNVSNDLTAEYKRHVINLGDASTSTGDKIDLEIKVLTSTFWPMSTMGNEQIHTCTYPAELERVKQSFQVYYLGRHNGRQLTWQPQMGTADIRATFKSRKHELNVSTYAMVILLLFNDPAIQSLSYKEIQTATSIQEGELIRNLQSLSVAPKTRILTKTPMSRDIKPTDRFSFNAGFTSKMMRIKVGVVKGTANKVETDKERRETEEKIDESRGHLIEAAIVRTMKSRNVLKHQELMLQITEQLSKRFMPEPQMIKKRIESLIEREYLERRADDPQTYVYLA